MTRIYLNEELKLYYSKSLKEVIEYSDEFWNLDDGIESHLLSINKSKNIRTIYSKRGKDLANHLYQSYLIITYTKNVEKELFDKIIPRILADYKVGRAKCNINEIEPYKREQKEINENNNGLKCIVDADYFYVNQVKFWLKGKNCDLHKKFWNDLNITFKNL